MALDFDNMFKAETPKAAAKEQRPKAEYWLNIGYPVNYPLEDGTTEKRLVSLPMGIPLDTQEKLPTNSRNKTFANFNAARNNLLEQIAEKAKGLQPGESVVLNLQVEMRRVMGDDQGSSKPENNEFLGFKL